MRTREMAIKARQRNSVKQKQRDRRRSQIKHWAKIEFFAEKKRALKQRDVDAFVNSLKEKAQEKMPVAQ